MSMCGYVHVSAGACGAIESPEAVVIGSSASCPMWVRGTKSTFSGKQQVLFDY